jgi:peroxiredoxin
MPAQRFSTRARGAPLRTCTTLLAAACALVVAAAPQASAGVRTGRRAPDLEGAARASGAPVRLDRFRGKWVVLTFGASWCGPCKNELSAWQRLAAGFRKRKARVVFVAVNIDEDQRKGARFMKRLGLRDVCVLFDPALRAVARYDPPKMPTTYVIDPTGVVRHIHPGYKRGDEKRLAARLDKLLAVAKGGSDDMAPGD